MNAPINPTFEECLRNISTKTGRSIEDVMKMVETISFDVEYGDWIHLDKKGKTHTFHVLLPSPIADFDRVAAFDMDNTLTYAEQHLYPSNPDDIHLLPGRVEVLNDFARNGYRLLLFTNQKAKTQKTIDKRLLRVRNFLNKIDLPITAFVATGDGPFFENDDSRNWEYELLQFQKILTNTRKPSVGAWKYYLENLTKYKNPEAVFCGDALGRPGDFSNSDYQFAQNVRRLLKQKVMVFEPEIMFPNSVVTISDWETRPTLVVMIGAPGTGKSKLSREIVEASANKARPFVRVNKDEMQSKWKKAFKEAIRTNQNVIVDNTNATLTGREELYATADGYQIIIVYLVNDGRRFNSQRARKVPDIAYHMFFKKLDPPTINEGGGQLFIIEGQNNKIDLFGTVEYEDEFMVGWPLGLGLISGFLDDEESLDLYTRLMGYAIWQSDSNTDRETIHYGYSKTKNADTRQVVKAREPPGWLLSMTDNMHEIGVLKMYPNQWTINKYEPGQGFAPLREHHPIFGDEIATLSLGSGCEMIFSPRNPKDGRPDVAIYLNVGSLLIVEGEARYEWNHHIPERKSDKIDGKRVKRGTRISVTFRYVNSDYQ